MGVPHGLEEIADFPLLEHERPGADRVRVEVGLTFHVGGGREHVGHLAADVAGEPGRKRHPRIGHRDRARERTGRLDAVLLPVREREVRQKRRLEVLHAERQGRSVARRAVVERQAWPQRDRPLREG